MKFGPGLLITAAFIGPGTITTASVTGANFGFALLWTIVFSVVATMVLQEMSARLGLVTKQGLAQALRNSFQNPLTQKLAITLIVAAIGVGNAAYEAGNITGAALGLEQIISLGTGSWALVIGVIAATLLWFGHYKSIERLFIALVLIMSLVFISTMIVAAPSLSEIAKGLVPSIPTGSLLTVIALIGTTVVPYNLFLHASSAKEKWGEEQDIDGALKASRNDTFVSVALGGVITISIVITAATAFYGQSGLSIANIAQQLEPILGSYATLFFAIGIFAAGITSAIAAPLAAGYAVCGAFNWSTDFNNSRFRLVWGVVLVIGTLFAAAGTKPITAILFAQAANGFILPVVAIFLIFAMNQKKLLGSYRNSAIANIAAGIVVTVVSLLGIYKLWTLFT